MQHAGKPYYINGKTAGTPGPATTTPLVVDVPGDVDSRTFANYLRLKNLSGGGNLLVTLDGQGPWTLATAEVLEIKATVQSITVTASAGTVQWEAMVVV